MNVSDLFEARNTMSVLKAAGAMDEKTRTRGAGGIQAAGQLR